MSEDRDEEYRAWRRVHAPEPPKKSWLQRLASPPPTATPQIAPPQTGRPPPTHSFLHGALNSALICPHCGEKGRVYTHQRP